MNGAFIFAYDSAVLYKLKHIVRWASCCELLKSSYEFTPTMIQSYKKKLMENIIVKSCGKHCIYIFFKWRFPCGPRLCSWLAFLMTKVIYSCRYTRQEISDRFIRILLRIKDKTRRTLPWLEYESFDQMSLVESTEEESGAGFWVIEERVISKHWVTCRVVFICSRWF